MVLNYWSRMAENENHENDILLNQKPDTAMPEPEDSLSEEVELQKSSDETDEVFPDEPVVAETEIVSLDDVRKDKDDAVMRQIEDILQEDSVNHFESSEDESCEVLYRSSKAAYICRVIFLDVPLGIPLLIASLVLVSVFIAVFVAVAIAFTAVFLLGITGALYLLAYGFINLAARFPMGLTGIGSGLIIAAFAMAALVLGLLVGFRFVPVIGSLYSKIYDKLGLFRRRTLD